MGYGPLIRHRPFLELWGGQAASLLGDALGRVALPVLAYAITSRVDVLAFAFAAQKLPSFLLAPAAGLLADRIDRRLLLRSALVLEAAAIATMAFSSFAWQVIGLTFLIGCAQVFQGPARSAALPGLLGRDLFPMGLAVYTATVQITDVLGQAAGGLLITNLSARTVLLLDAATFVIFAVLAPKLPNAPRPDPARPASLLSELAAGALFLRGNRVIRTIVLVMMIRGATATGALSILYGLITSRANGDATVFGLVSSVFGAALTLSSLWFGRRAEFTPPSRTLGIYTIIAGAFLIPLALQPPLLVAAGLLVGFALFYAPGNIAASAGIAEGAPEARRGQVISISWALIMGSQVIGGVIAGVTTGIVGADRTLALAGLILAALIIPCLSAIRVVDRK